MDITKRNEAHAMGNRRSEFIEASQNIAYHSAKTYCDFVFIDVINHVTILYVIATLLCHAVSSICHSSYALLLINIINTMNVYIDYLPKVLPLFVAHYIRMIEH